MNERLKAYLDKCGRATVDETVVDDLRRKMEQVVPKIAENIRQREELAAELRVSASKVVEPETEKQS